VLVHVESEIAADVRVAAGARPYDVLDGDLQQADQRRLLGGARAWTGVPGMRAGVVIMAL